MRMIKKLCWFQMVRPSGRRVPVLVAALILSAAVNWLVSGTTQAQTITGLTNQFYWRGTNNAVFATAANWSTNSASTGTTSQYPGTFTSGVGIFNVSASNNVNQTVTVGAAMTLGGLIFNDAGNTTITGTVATAAFTLNGFTNDTSGILYGFVLNPGAGAVMFGTTNSSTDVPLTLNTNQTWLNNGNGLLSISNSITTGAATTLTLAGTNGFYLYGALSDTAANQLTLVDTAYGTVTLAASNVFQGKLLIQRGDGGVDGGWHDG